MKVEVIGRGNVGSQFAKIFGVIPVDSRTLEGLSDEADLYLIAVSDSAVEEVAGRLPKVDGIVVHTTGSVSVDALKHVRCKGYGVFYPFQTISRRRILEARNIPLLIEADNDKTARFLMDTAKVYGFDKIEFVDSEKRRKVHLCGTFACNFTNAMIAISQKILSECGIDPDIANPLIEETFEKSRKMAAKEAQTGPAIRKDFSTMMKHCDLLEKLGMDREKEIYRTVSEYIMDESWDKERKL